MTLRTRTPLQRRSPLRARTALRAKSALARTSSLRPVSKKRAAQNRERRAMKNQRWPDGERPLCAAPGPSHWADDLHEIKTRARGGSITDEKNTVPLCRAHNEMLSQRPESELGWAYDLELLRHSWEAA